MSLYIRSPFKSDSDKSDYSLTTTTSDNITTSADTKSLSPTLMSFSSIDNNNNNNNNIKKTKKNRLLSQRNIPPSLISSSSFSSNTSFEFKDTTSSTSKKSSETIILPKNRFSELPPLKSNKKSGLSTTSREEYKQSDSMRIINEYCEAMNIIQASSVQISSSEKPPPLPHHHHDKKGKIVKVKPLILPKREKIQLQKTSILHDKLKRTLSDDDNTNDGGSSSNSNKSLRLSPSRWMSKCTPRKIYKKIFMSPHAKYSSYEHNCNSMDDENLSYFHNINKDIDNKTRYYDRHYRAPSTAPDRIGHHCNTIHSSKTPTDTISSSSLYDQSDSNNNEQDLTETIHKTVIKQTKHKKSDAITLKRINKKKNRKRSANNVGKKKKNRRKSKDHLELEISQGESSSA